MVEPNGIHNVTSFDLAVLPAPTRVAVARKVVDTVNAEAVRIVRTAIFLAIVHIRLACGPSPSIMALAGRRFAVFRICIARSVFARTPIFANIAKVGEFSSISSWELKGG